MIQLQPRRPQLENTQVPGLISSPSRSYLYLQLTVHEKFVLLGKYIAIERLYGKVQKLGIKGNGIIYNHSPCRPRPLALLLIISE